MRAGKRGCARISSIGFIISVSGVRNSWLTLEKNVRLGTIDLGQRLGALAFRFEGTRIRNARGDMARDEIEEGAVVGSRMRRGLTPAIRKPAGRGWVGAASGSTKAVSTGSGHGPAGKTPTVPGRSDIWQTGWSPRLRLSGQGPLARLPSMTGWFSGKTVEPSSNRVPATRRALIPSSSSR